MSTEGLMERDEHSVSDGPLLRIDDLVKTYEIRERGRTKSVLRALGGVSFEVQQGETFGVVGESGCGKSTLARCILRLIEPDGGRILFGGTDLAKVDRRALRALRRRIQIVFQDPYASLDPRMRVASIVEEPLVVHGIGDREQRAEMVTKMLVDVGLLPDHAERKPHEFSGGQRQRIGIARALVLQPELVILDEPVSALDVSVQAQVLNLLGGLRSQFGLTYVFVAHDLAVAEYFCDRLAVLYLGQVMELADRDELFQRPLHPYTVSLLAAVPRLGRKRTGPRRAAIRGEATAVDVTSIGCPFQPRCPVGHGRSVCLDTQPALTEPRPGHWVACHCPEQASLDDVK